MSKSENLTSGSFDWNLLKNARSVAKEDPEAMKILDQAQDHCRTMEHLHLQIQEEMHQVNPRPAL